jgi:hypothetical protein
MFISISAFRSNQPHAHGQCAHFPSLFCSDTYAPCVLACARIYGNRLLCGSQSTCNCSQQAPPSPCAVFRTLVDPVKPLAMVGGRVLFAVICARIGSHFAARGPHGLVDRAFLPGWQSQEGFVEEKALIDLASHTLLRGMTWSRDWSQTRFSDITGSCNGGMLSLISSGCWRNAMLVARA